MNIPLETLNWLVGLGAVIMEVGAAVLFVTFFLRKKNPTAGAFSRFVGKYGLWAGFLPVLTALVMSLYYSEVLGFAPCGLCWATRVFIYSQVFLFATALIKKDRKIADYSIVLSLAGLCIGLYQHYLQMGGADILPCPASPEAADCAKRILFEFDHVTFPWVGVAMFLFVIGAMLHVRGGAKEDATSLS